MSEEKRRILIVDDSANDIHVLMENLKQDYAVLAATGGEKALELAARDPQPDVILLDVMMPDMDGYETCRRLKEDPKTADISVIFVSAHDTTEEKLAGYTAGGSDYLIKPVHTGELKEKVKHAIESLDAYRAATEAAGYATQTAMTALSNAGEQGVVLDFMRRSFTTNSIEELAQLIVEVTSNYDLENSVQISLPQGCVYASTTDPMPPLEQELLLRLKDAGRLRENGNHLVANFGAITQLIKNMPEDEDKCGRLRDHFALLLEGAENRLHALNISQELTHVVADSNRALQDIQATQKMLKERAVQIMDDVMKGLEESFMSYGLTEEQENLLFNIVRTGVDKSLDNFEEGIKVDDQLHAIVERLMIFSRR